jgi:hypothetical protein
MKPPRVLPLAFGVLSVCAAASGGVPKADVSLTNASASLSQTSDTSWTLTKTGVVNTGSSTVTWTVTATQGATVAGHLVVNGFMTVTNSGGAGATIGNIVVNLQTKFGSSWVTRSSDVADATQGDAATTAHIDPHASSENLSTFTENAASGQLLFMDANTNTVFSLVPEVTIAPGATVNLLFSAAFDNNVLALPVGKAVRAEVIVSFGNAGTKGPVAPNVDINGNGVIDPDEAWVRSVPTRLGLTVPAATPANSTPTLTDTAGDIATTGTVTFSNAVFNLGATTGTVTVHYDGGTTGGTITNCAHLTGTGSTVVVGGVTFTNVGAVNLQACNTQTIGATTCTPGTTGCGWHDGDVITWNQASWGDTPTSTNAAGLLLDNYDAVYASSSGVFEVGISGSSGFSMLFTSAVNLQAYLPSAGTIGPLVADLADPTSSSSGAFGGEVAALKINIDFSDAGLTAGTSAVKFGNLTLCGFTTLTALNGLTVRDFASEVNTLLGGGSATYSITDLDPITIDLNASFGGGGVNSFAQDHLVNGACP